MNETTKRPILVLDFDGVLHSYASGWQGADVVADPPVPGAAEFCREAVRHFRVFVVSSRNSQPGGLHAMTTWLHDHGFPDEMVLNDGTKPAAFVTIDDRAITFEGRWPEIPTLLAFRPWNERSTIAPDPDRGQRPVPGGPIGSAGAEPGSTSFGRSPGD